MKEEFVGLLVLMLAFCVAIAAWVVILTAIYRLLQGLGQ